MSSFWKTIIALSAFIAVVQCLSCYQCPVDIAGNCGFNDQVTCADGQQCITVNATFSENEDLVLARHGCAPEALCNQMITLRVPGVDLSANVSTSCCNEDLCNGATSVQLSLTAVACAVLLPSLWRM